MCVHGGLGGCELFFSVINVKVNIITITMAIGKGLFSPVLAEKIIEPVNVFLILALL